MATSRSPRSTFPGWKKNSGLPITLPLLRKVLASIFYGDMLCALRSQVKPYEDTPGAADETTERWIAEIQGWMRESRNYSGHDMKREFPRIAADFAKIPARSSPRSRSVSSAKFTSNIRRWATTTWKSSWKARTAKSTCPA